VSNEVARLITNCRDLALLLPRAAILAFVLWHFDSRAATAAWLQALAFCLVATFLLKLGFLTCCRAWSVNFVSASGHASMSALVYGGIAIVIARQSTRWRVPIVLVGVTLIVTIALTRTILQAHTRAGVAIGLGVVLVSLSVFAWRYFQLPNRKIDLPWVGVGTACIFPLLYGIHLPVESFLYKLSHSVRPHTFICRSIGSISPVSLFDAQIIR
jgi:membrane-associated phospholipid phosphatase